MSTATPEESIDDLAGFAPGSLIDVRSPEEFADGHVPGAVNVPLDDVLADPSRHARDHAVHVICASGRRSLAATEAMVAVGVPAVSVAGGTQAWIDAGRPVEH